MTDHPTIVLPRELMQQWREQVWFVKNEAEREERLMERAAQWGADQELEACCELLDSLGGDGEMIRRYRRPKPPSLKEQALKTLEDAPGPDYPMAMTVLNADQHALIRKALETLPE